MRSLKYLVQFYVFKCLCLYQLQVQGFSQSGIDFELVDGLYEIADIQANTLKKNNLFVTGTSNQFLSTSIEYQGLQRTGRILQFEQHDPEAIFVSTSLAIDDQNGDVYVVGFSNYDQERKTVNENGYGDYMLAKYHGSNSSLAYLKIWGTDEDDLAIGVTVDSASHSVYVSGTVGGKIDGQVFKGGADIILFKFDTNGTKLWTRTFGQKGIEFGWQCQMGSTSDEIYLTGFIDNYYGFVQKYHSNGTLLWTTTMKQPSSFNALTVARNIDGQDRVYVTGYVFGPIDEHTTYMADVIVTYFDANNGTRAPWSIVFGGNGIDFGYDLVIHPQSKHILVTGTTNDRIAPQVKSQGGQDAFLSAFHFNGTNLWHKQFGSQMNDISSAITILKDGNVFIGGVWNEESAFIGQLSSLSSTGIGIGTDDTGKETPHSRSALLPIVLILGISACAVYIVYKKRGPHAFDYVLGRRARLDLPFLNTNRRVRLDDVYDISPREGGGANIVNPRNTFPSQDPLADDDDMLQAETDPLNAVKRSQK
ncbi:hypothetical protein MP228_009361 [Amoeboaphelidium protococcarum]|nr:hypothetical protein MP228_009361 [Amoeboaphelidium protococcarum]